MLEEELAFREARGVLVPLKPAHPDPQLDRVLQVLRELGFAESQAALARAAGVGVGRVRRLVQEGYIGTASPEEAAPPPADGVDVAPLHLPERPERVNGGRFLERVRVLKGLLGEGDHLVLFPEVSLLERFLAHFPGATPYHGGFPARSGSGFSGGRAAWSSPPTAGSSSPSPPLFGGGGGGERELQASLGEPGLRPPACGA